ncbi:hypothetical protein MLD38_017733 [Melastoma candidum]|uniref:Uncharacterized protein n=1 Tax=Melastoma candidum TaxID=119954 RepID=A0ACB9QVP3_9MYRT|nr:hypothetical protein MLD38_017733 [Melastoma candidum]
MVFEGLKAVIGEAAPERRGGGGAPLRRFLYYVHSPDPSHLRIHVTDFHSNTWEALRSVSQFEDMKDSIGFGGTWSDFMDYFLASIQSNDVKLILDGQSDSRGAGSARLVAQKAKGMPVIVISLLQLDDPEAREAISNLSLELFSIYKSTCSLPQGDQRHGIQSVGVLSTAKDANGSVKGNLNSYSKKQKLPDTTTGASSDQSNHDASKDTRPAKVVNTRVVPVHRRSKVRGAVLLNPEDDVND